MTGATDVLLHVYSVDAEVEMPDITASANALTSDEQRHFAAHHIGVEVHGKEWSFRKEALARPHSAYFKSGVFSVMPNNTTYFLIESIPVGTTRFTADQVEALMERMAKRWRPDTHHPVRRNCYKFCEVICSSLGVDPVPPRVMAWAPLRKSVVLPSVVRVHVYDVAGESTEGTNNVVYSTFKIGGVFHAGVEIYGLEWSFGYVAKGAGVFPCKPKQNPAHKYRKTVTLGETSLSRAEVLKMVKGMEASWQGPSYDFLKRNCCHFSEELCANLNAGRMPTWINRLAHAGAAGHGAGMKLWNGIGKTGRGIGRGVNVVARALSLIAPHLPGGGKGSKGSSSATDSESSEDGLGETKSKLGDSVRLHHIHKHPLVLTDVVKTDPHYKGSWACDGCSRKGRSAVWHCGRCNYDLCPTCHGDATGPLDDLAGAAPKTHDCLLCGERPQTVAMSPCEHRCLCGTCARKIKERGGGLRCPICHIAGTRLHRVGPSPVAPAIELTSVGPLAVRDSSSPEPPSSQPLLLVVP